MTASYQTLDSKPADKYIIQNGRVMLNPDYKSDGKFDPSAPPAYDDAVKPLTMVSTLQDQMDISAVTQLEAPKQFQKTLMTMQSPDYVKAFEAKGVDGGTLVDGLMSVFKRNEIPIGLMSKLVDFKGATLHFKIDDSGSMTRNSNLLISELSPYMQKVASTTERKNTTRWEEAEDRLHILIDLVAYVPTGPIILSFFDRNQPGDRIILDRKGKSPQEFLADAHKKISRLFLKEPDGDTPILKNLTNMMNEANQERKGSDNKTMHYILSDGEPSGGAEEIRQIKDLLKSPYNRNASLNPVTFLGCSNVREDYKWMHEMEEVAPYVAALPDFRDELLEVRQDQGKVFPYSRGMWLLCNVAAAINPEDLDALDQHWPLTKPTLENLMGRGLTESEYLQYFNSHPNARRVFGDDYQLFLQNQSASGITTVRIFQDTLKQCLNRDMDNDEDDTEERDELIAEQAVIDYRKQRYSGRFFNPAPNLNQPLLPQQSSQNDCCSCVIL